MIFMRTRHLNIVAFHANMMATRYTQILDAAFVPFATSVYPEGHRLYQDNDPKHTSQWAQWYFQKKTTSITPAESPDVNPIELVWGSMKQAIRNDYKPRTLDELESAIKHYWATKLTPEVCQRYVRHIHKVLPRIVEVNGAATGM